MSDNERDDPFQVKQLAVQFDYVLYKIKDKVEQMAETTQASILKDKEQQDLEISRVKQSISRDELLLKQCDELESEFEKLDQLSVITGEFRHRIKEVEKKLRSKKR